MNQSQGKVPIQMETIWHSSDSCINSKQGQDVLNCVSLSHYHKGAHGVLSSKKGYGHLGKLQRMLVLEPEA